MSFWKTLLKSPYEERGGWELDFTGMSDLTMLEIGNHAEDALRNPAIKAAFDLLYKRLTSEWRKTSDDDIDTREVVFNRIRAVESLEQVLRGFFNSAVLERESIDQKIKDMANG